MGVDTGGGGALGAEAPPQIFRLYNIIYNNTYMETNS